jgi:hypothetical protein
MYEPTIVLTYERMNLAVKYSFPHDSYALIARRGRSVSATQIVLDFCCFLSLILPSFDPVDLAEWKSVRIVDEWTR